MWAAGLILAGTGCSGFMAPHARMEGPTPELLSSRGVLPPPKVLPPDAVGRRPAPVPDSDSEYNGWPAPPPPAHPSTTDVRPFDDNEFVPPTVPPVPDIDDDTPAPSDASPTLTHTVKPGDSLWKISRRYGVSIQALATYNDMHKDDILPVGKVLQIPPGGTAPEDTGGGTSTSSDPGTERSPTRTRIPRDGKYNVRSGDNLWDLSRKFGVTLSQLREWNDLDSDVLQIGQTLFVRPPADDASPVDQPRERAPEDEGETTDTDIDEPGDPTTTVSGVEDTDPGPDDAPVPAFPSRVSHTVIRGDTLAEIATMYDITVRAIKQANPDIDGDEDLEVGKQVVIPLGD
jgi:LysM repeat protein